MTSSIDCPDCDAPNRASNRTCHACGAKMPAPQPRPRQQDFGDPPPLREPPPHVLEKHPCLARHSGEPDEEYAKRCRAWMQQQAKAATKRIAAEREASRRERQARPADVRAAHEAEMERLRAAGLDTSGAYREEDAA